METPIMSPRLTRILLLHGPVAGTYMALTGFIFVLLPEPRPVLFGILQSALICLHLALTALFCLRLRLPRRLLMAHLAVLFLVIAILQLANRPYWNLLWYLRVH
jgi:putative Ca2+/H+ antiporter (TMEM165/GDT1 family)